MGQLAIPSTPHPSASSLPSALTHITHHITTCAFLCSSIKCGLWIKQMITLIKLSKPFQYLNRNCQIMGVVVFSALSCPQPFPLSVVQTVNNRGGNSLILETKEQPQELVQETAHYVPDRCCDSIGELKSIKTGADQVKVQIKPKQLSHQDLDGCPLDQGILHQTYPRWVSPSHSRNQTKPNQEDTFKYHVITL